MKKTIKNLSKKILLFFFPELIDEIISDKMGEYYEENYKRTWTPPDGFIDYDDLPF